MMTAKQAAELIGCTTRHVRTLIQRGKLKAKRVEHVFQTKNGEYIQYEWLIYQAEVIRYRDTEFTNGWPRGKKRKPRKRRVRRARETRRARRPTSRSVRNQT